MNAKARTATEGQRFAAEMRHFLAIGTRTRRDRKGLDLHAEIADWIRIAAMEPGTLRPDQEAVFKAAFDAACSWYKHIKAGRASYLVIEHINAMSPWQFCTLLGQMIDAGITTTSQGGQYFSELRATLAAATADDTEEVGAPGQPQAVGVATTDEPDCRSRTDRRTKARTARSIRRQRSTDTHAARRAHRNIATGTPQTARTHLTAAGLDDTTAHRYAAAFSRGVIADGTRTAKVKLKGRVTRRVQVKLYNAATFATRLATYRPKDKTAAARFEQAAHRLAA